MTRAKGKKHKQQFPVWEIRQEKGIEEARMREILDPVEPAELRPVFKRLVEQLDEEGMLERYRFLDQVLPGIVRWDKLLFIAAGSLR